MSVLASANELIFLEITGRLARKLEPEIASRIFPLSLVKLPFTHSDTSSPTTSSTLQNISSFGSYHSITLSSLSLFERCLIAGLVTYAGRLLTLTCEDCFNGSESVESIQSSLCISLELFYQATRLFSLQIAIQCAEFCLRLEEMLECVLKEEKQLSALSSETGTNLQNKVAIGTMKSKKMFLSSIPLDDGFGVIFTDRLNINRNATCTELIGISDSFVIYFSFRFSAFQVTFN
jgi:hypothetical protein